MTKDISENDLPSVKFEKDIKDRMNYSALKRFVKNKTEDDEIDKWIQSFQKKVEQYLTDSSKDSSFDHDKRCKHFNYLIITTISKITSLSDDFQKKADWSKKIKDWRDRYYGSNSKFTCDNFNNYVSNNEKSLGTFCEDSFFINNKIPDIKKSVYCQKIVNTISARKGNLESLRARDEIKGIFTKINDICSTQFLDTIFTTFTCNSNVERPLTSDELDSSAQHGIGEESSEGLVSQTQPYFGSLVDGSHGSITMPGENESSNDSSSNAIGLVSLPILGVSVCSFLLYRFTPFGSKFLGYFRNKGDIPLNQDYEKTAQMLSNTPNLNNMYSENMQYNLSYQTL
ncbi:PIR Superfamily Protein [Plasmodium ovale wallikeri]|uniref:PIR Superfamily Protein n=1 Tax=Plasmodium ovale wallikeri TaxID=864142 RepID=A0A1A9AR16_PLAOA|nr:PIR Superfamily Protein [Plasmodium ovale wallikeri]SBT58616.1 PIR Superfamily Protein [Plasmodium ovale wallikeri]